MRPCTFSLSDETLNPPFFNSEVDDYAKWKRLINIWLYVTDLAKTKQGGVIVLRLDEDTRNEVLDVLLCDEISADDGVHKVLEVLDTIFQEDHLVSSYRDYEDFVKYQRPEHISIKEYCCQFQRKLVKVEATGTVIADNVLAFKLLKSAKLKLIEEQLIMATVSGMHYEEVLHKLKHVFGSYKSYKYIFTSGIEEVTRDAKCSNTNHIH